MTGRAEYLRDIAGLLWPGEHRVTIGRGGGGFLLVPSGQAPKLLLPEPRRAAAGAVLGYGGHGSTRAWLTARGLAAALATGAAGLAFRDRLRVRGGEPGLDAHLSAVLGQDVLVALHIGPPRANRKPVLQLLTAAGETLAFAKLGINDLTRRLVRDEAATLRAVAAAGLPHLQTPRVLHAGNWRELAVLVQSPLPVRAARPTPAGKRVAAMRAVASAGEQDTGYLEVLRTRLGTLADHSDVPVLVAALEWAAAGDPLPRGGWHGDWTPWNTAYLAERDTVLVWDWERYAAGVPRGYDALHHSLQTAIVGGPHAEHAAALLDAAPQLLEPFGVAPDDARRIGVLYLVEIAARYLGDGQAAAGGAVGRIGEWLLPVLSAVPATPPTAPRT